MSNYGGYDNSYGGGTGYMGETQSGSQQTPGRSAHKNTLRPVTIKQILDAKSSHDDSSFTIDDVELGNITFVAQIRNIAPQATNITYKMEDGTGSIEVKQFKDKNSSMMDDDESGTGDLQVNSYARVVGNIKQFNDKKNIGTQSVRLVTDFNEIQCHFLEATVAHLHCLRGAAPDSQQARPGAAAGYQQGAASYTEDTSMGHTAGGAAASMLPPGMSANARKIYAFLKNRPDSSEGMHIAVISQSANVPMSETYKAVDELLTNGVCFTTMDDEHIACMDF